MSQYLSIFTKLLYLLLLVVTESSFAFQAESVSSEAGLGLKKQFLSPRFDSSFIYAQSLESWSVVSQMKSAEGQVSKINPVLKSKYGTYEAMFSSASFDFKNGRFPFNLGPISNWNLGVSAEGVGTGYVNNPVIPELHARLLLGGLAHFGVSTPSSRMFSSSLNFVWGMGVEKRVDAVSTDLIEKLPVRNGRFHLLGIDPQMKFSKKISDLRGYKSDLSLRMSWVNSDIAKSTLDEIQKDQTFFYRWRWSHEIEQSLQWKTFYGSSISFEYLLGPQPLPAQVLPRLWDYANNPAPFPELGAMMGYGPKFKLSPSQHVEFNGSTGVYAGYFGAMWSAGSPSDKKGFNWKLSVASFGIENSAAYLVQGQRIYLSSLALGF